jgi:hypothetical protein
MNRKASVAILASAALRCPAGMMLACLVCDKNARETGSILASSWVNVKLRNVSPRRLADTAACGGQQHVLTALELPHAHVVVE